MGQPVPFPCEMVPSGIANFMPSTNAEYFYKDVVWEIIDHNRGSVCYQYGERTKILAINAPM